MVEEFKLEENPMLDIVETILAKYGLESSFTIVLSDFIKRLYIIETDRQI